MMKEWNHLCVGNYLTKVASDPGAGDILMGFLGSVILSFAFSMFKQRKLVKKHAAEIFTSVIVSTVFSLYSTALVGRLVDENSRDGGGKDPIVGSVRELCLIIDRFGMIWIALLRD